MAEEILASVQVRRDNKANWEAVNPILLDGEAAYEKDTDMFKIGDGVNNYKNLPYHNKVGPKGDTGATPQISMSVSTGAAGSEASVSVSGTAENPLISLTIPRGDTGASGVTQETDPTVPAWAKQPNKPTYTASEVGALPSSYTPPVTSVNGKTGAVALSAQDVGARPDTWTPSASEVGADASGTASGAVAAHNTSGAAHADLRALIEGLTSRLNALADSDDETLDQLSEIVAYIKSNKALIDEVTTGKVSTSDIVDNLTTNASGKVLSAAQGVALKRMIDAIVIPDKLPNPQPLTINGQSYDGSSAVSVTVTGEGGGVEVDNTLTQSGKAADSKVVGDKLSKLNEAKVNNADLAKVAKTGSYDDLTGKPTIPTVPTTLPNPNKLKLTGAVTAEYDGSSEVSVEIPAGGGSGSYTLPIASATQLGGVMPVAKTGDMTQAVGVDGAGGLWTAPGSGGGGNWITVGDVTLTEETSEIRFVWRNSTYPFNIGRIYVLNAHLVGAAGAESELDVKQLGEWPELGTDSGWLFGNNLYKVPADGKTKDIVETVIAFEKVLGDGGQVIRFVNGVQSLNTNFAKDRCQGVMFRVSGNFGVGTKYKLMFKDL